MPGRRIWPKIIVAGITDPALRPLHFLLRLGLNITSKNAGTERSISIINLFCGKSKFIIETLGGWLSRAAYHVWVENRQQCLGSDAFAPTTATVVT